MSATICDNCGDGKGWHRFSGTWAACADCNDDGKKPKPDFCEGCGETEPFCWCESGQAPVIEWLI